MSCPLNREGRLPRRSGDMLHLRLSRYRPDLGSPVSEAYYDKPPFTFNGTIAQVQVQYTR